jgi:hypothetical protein
MHGIQACLEQQLVHFFDRFSSPLLLRLRENQSARADVGCVDGPSLLLASLQLYW